MTDFYDTSFYVKEVTGEKATENTAKVNSPTYFFRQSEKKQQKILLMPMVLYTFFVIVQQ